MYIDKLLVCLQVSVSALMASNGMKDGDSILAGEFITIPKEKE